MSDENIGKKIQDAEQIGTEKVGDKEIPILKPEVYVKIYCSNCNAEVDDERRLLAIVTTVVNLGPNQRPRMLPYVSLKCLKYLVMAENFNGSHTHTFHSDVFLYRLNVFLNLFLLLIIFRDICPPYQQGWQ